jgi:hypothetical protein
MSWVLRSYIAVQITVVTAAERLSLVRCIVF